jgi:hypothetical protein
MKSKKSVDYTIGNYRFVGDGVEYQLKENEYSWMTYNNSNDIAATQLYSSYDLAYGDCILSGLGMGILLEMLSKKTNVTRIRVYEKSIDVIMINYKFGSIPDNVEIINQPIENMKNVDCDCLLFDHWETESFEYKKENMRDIVSNNNPKLVWFWTHENEFYKKYKEKINKKYNFNEIYDEWLKELSIPGIPQVSEEQMNLYIDKYITDDKLMEYNLNSLKNKNNKKPINT